MATNAVQWIGANITSTAEPRSPRASKGYGGSESNEIADSRVKCPSTLLRQGRDSRGLFCPRLYILFAINVRTNHVHLVVSSSAKVELMVNAFKAYATRRLRSEGLVDLDAKVWSRHESTRYLWTEKHISDAIEYVVHGQGLDLPMFD